jgi:hypothetical protein
MGKTPARLHSDFLLVLFLLLSVRHFSSLRLCPFLHPCLPMDHPPLPSHRLHSILPPTFPHVPLLFHTGSGKMRPIREKERQIVVENSWKALSETWGQLARRP